MLLLAALLPHINKTLEISKNVSLAPVILFFVGIFVLLDALQGPEVQI